MPSVFGTPDNYANCAIVRDADWLDPLPTFLEEGAPRDLTGMQLFIYVRPTYDAATPILILSTQTGKIIIDNATAGLASIYMPRHQVIAYLPAGTWVWFCVMRDPADNTTTELFRGQLQIHDGLVS